MATITIEQAKEISLLQRRVGRRKLAVCLKWKPFDEEENGQQSIRLDYLYDNLTFTTQKGFPWNQVCRLLSLASEMLDETIGLSLVEALMVYKKKSAECLRSVSEHNLNIYSDFFFHTFMQHFKLYQFVYLNDRQCNVNKIHLEVATPPKQDSFTEAKPVMVWEYNKTVEDIKEEVAHRKLEHEQNIENTLKEDEERKMMMALNLNNISVPMNREDILQMIQDVATVNITHTSHQLEASIAILLDDFDMMFEPTAVPRPAVMGPPPRFDMKSTPKSSPTPSRGRSPSLGQKARRSPKDKGFNSK